MAGAINRYRAQHGLPPLRLRLTACCPIRMLSPVTRSLIVVLSLLVASLLGCGGGSGGASSSSGFDPYNASGTVESWSLAYSKLSPPDATSRCSYDGTNLGFGHFEYQCQTSLKELPFQQATINWDSKSNNGMITSSCTGSIWQAKGLGTDTPAC